MVMKLTREQCGDCAAALREVLEKGFTNRMCPLCGQKLIIDTVGESGEVRCETENCFGKLTFRGI